MTSSLMWLEPADSSLTTTMRDRLRVVVLLAVSLLALVVSSEGVLLRKGF